MLFITIFRELRLQMLIIDSFIPREYLDIIDSNVAWNEDIGEWQLRYLYIFIFSIHLYCIIIKGIRLYVLIYLCTYIYLFIFLSKVFIHSYIFISGIHLYLYIDLCFYIRYNLTKIFIYN